MDGLSALNSLGEEEAQDRLLRCLGSRRWVSALLKARPYRGAAELFELAERASLGLGAEDWLEAFSRHPRVGDREALRSKFSSDAWAAREQAGAAGAGEGVLEALAEGNREYERRFGYIFIVCATGKSAERMLELLRARLGNDPETELRAAAEEQRKISRLRLEKLLEDLEQGGVP